MKNNRILRPIAVVAMATALLAFQSVTAQQPGPFEVPASQPPLDAAALETLVGPVALYADDLLGIVLPASTYPLQIVQASRFLDDLQEDDSLEPDPNWDDSVVALLNYPEVLRMMDTNIEWTWALGEAVIDQQPAVLDAVQAFRGRALQAGNLASNDQQTVTQNDGLIEIAPAEPEVIYIPYYEPERVVVVQPRPVVYYYSHAYPIYYYPYPYGYTFGYTFGSPFFWGVSAAFNIGWHSHVVHVYHHSHYAHPYYAYKYYSPYYWRHGVNVSVNYTNYAWQPRHRYAGRPHRTASGTRSVASREGSAANLRNASYSQVRARSQTRTATRDDTGRNFANRSATSRAATSQSTASRAAPSRSTAAPSTRAQAPSATSQRSYTGRPVTSASSRTTPPTFSGTPRSRAATSARPGRNAVAPPGRSAVAQPRTQRSQPSVSSSTSTLGQRKAFGAQRSTGSSNASRPAYSSPSSGTSSRSAPRSSSGGRAMTSGGRSMSSGGRSMSSGGRAMSSGGGRSSSAGGRTRR